LRWASARSNFSDFAFSSASRASILQFRHVAAFRPRRRCLPQTDRAFLGASDSRNRC
jgi:hypothetical protein